MNNAIDQAVERLLRARADGDRVVVEQAQEELQRLKNLQQVRRERGKQIAAMQAVTQARQAIERNQSVDGLTPTQLVWLRDEIDTLLLAAREVRAQIRAAIDS